MGSPPDQNAIGKMGSPWIEAAQRVAEDHFQRHVPRLVAHRIRIDFHRSDAIEKAQRKPTRDQRASPGIVGMQDAVSACAFNDLVEAGGDQRECIVPMDRLEFSFAFAADPAQRCAQADSGIAPRAIVGDGAFAT